ncbi:phosphoglycolate phosphatase [Roseitranquillus sediminis]|uniref:phosphoglycolate phosphatase n=1 Tax=Roseitranquillus sediminis TaxID=2809051 RepID=UPI001D0CBEE5|nr:phosphoglycolate phosphatase [Roseitranquillus sediminis]
MVFDLDGTLVDSVADIHAATNRMLHEVALQPLDLATVRGFIGHGVPRLVAQVMETRAVTPARHDEMVRVFLRHYRAAPADLTDVIQDVPAALEELRREGHALGVCTNKPGELARAVLDRLGLACHFSAVLGGDEVPVAKPDPAPLIETVSRLGGGPAIYVGDSEVDADTARRADVPFLLYTEGYRKRPVEELPAAATFDSFAALPSLVRRVLKH